jgi:hypothetical protein
MGRFGQGNLTHHVCHAVCVIAKVKFFDVTGTGDKPLVYMGTVSTEDRMEMDVQDESA